MSTCSHGRGESGHRGGAACSRRDGPQGARPSPAGAAVGRALRRSGDGQPARRAAGRVLGLDELPPAPARPARVRRGGSRPRDRTGTLVACHAAADPHGAVAQRDGRRPCGPRDLRRRVAPAAVPRRCRLPGAQARGSGGVGDERRRERVGPLPHPGGARRARRRPRSTRRPGGRAAGERDEQNAPEGARTVEVQFRAFPRTSETDRPTEEHQ